MLSKLVTSIFTEESMYHQSDEIVKETIAFSLFLIGHNEGASITIDDLNISIQYEWKPESR